MDGTRKGRTTKLFMTHSIACNKDLITKEKPKESTVSINIKF